MATYTSNYGWAKPSGSDNVDISVLNDNLDDQDSTIHDAFLNMAPPFSESSTYAVDDIVLYGTGLYKCHTAVVTPGSWTGSTNWQVYKLSEGGSGGGGTSNYNDLTNKPSINGVTLTGNKTTSDLGIDKTAVGLGNVPNVSTNDQTPTFTEASTRNNIASGEKLSVIMGKIQKFFNDLKTVAFSGSYTDLTNKPTIPTSAGDITYDNTDSGLSATNVQGALDELRQADNIMMSDGETSVGEAIDDVADRVILLGSISASDFKSFVNMVIDKFLTYAHTNQVIYLVSAKKTNSDFYTFIMQPYDDNLVFFTIYPASPNYMYTGNRYNGTLAIYQYSGTSI